MMHDFNEYRPKKNKEIVDCIYQVNLSLWKDASIVVSDFHEYRPDV